MRTSYTNTTARPGAFYSSMDELAPGYDGKSRYRNGISSYDADTTYIDFASQYQTDFLDKYKGTDIYNQLANNAYIGYVPTSLTGEALYDFFNKRFTQAREYASQLLDAQRQQEFNSPVAARAREIAAGANPDLAGIGTGEQPAVDATPAVENSPVSSLDSALAFAEQGNRSFDLVSGLMNAGSNFLNGILGVASAIQSLGLGSVQRGLLDVALGDAAYDLALKEEAGRKVMPKLNSDGTVDYSSVPDLVIEPVVGKGKARGKAGKALQRARGNILYSEDGRPTTALQRAYMENVAGATGATKQAGVDMATPGFSEDLPSFAAGYSDIIYERQLRAMDLENNLRSVDSLLRKAEIGLTQQQTSLASEQTRGAAAESDYKEGYYSTELGSDMSYRDRAVAKLDSIEAELDELEVETYKALADWIRKPEHGSIGKYGVILLPGLREEVRNIFATQRQAIQQRRELTGKLLGSVASAAVGAL